VARFLKNIENTKALGKNKNIGENGIRRRIV
jgi:hypothetical protein